MLPLAVTFGLRPPPYRLYFSPNYAATFLIANFISAYLLLSTRGIKAYYRFDHNTSPREDVPKYGPRLVSDGKISQSTLNMIKRWESAHANAVENYPLFATGVLLALYARVPIETVNGLMALYTLARVAYAVAYVGIESMKWSAVRTVFWWVGNVCCLMLMGMAGKKLQV